MYGKIAIFSDDDLKLRLTNLLLQDFLLLPILTVENSKFHKPSALQIRNGSIIIVFIGKDTKKNAFLPSTGPLPASSIPIQHGSLNVMSGIMDFTVKFLELSSNELRSMLEKQAATGGDCISRAITAS